MKTKAILIFPYSGYENKSERSKMFWRMVECCHDYAGDKHPIVILNKDTEKREQAAAFLQDKRSKDEVEILRVWSVDTCQMWLAGWGHVIDNCKGVSRIIQLPGDIDSVSTNTDFFNQLKGFITYTKFDIVIGDFSTEGRFNAKDLIDSYGTYALLANWFPEVTQEILHLPLNRPRSEFLNIRTRTLKRLLDERKFAYEQTVNMLIHSWDFRKGKWKFKIHAHKLGILTDDGSFRQYTECLDQIERTERMIKLLWREVHKPNDDLTKKSENKQSVSKKNEKIYEDFIDKYHVLDKRSTSIRENARIIISNLLKVNLR
ncbi:MAG: hypothetical protein BBJ57_13935 [Desulfobacterales bacterium PC51MH44]|nr:MAG: hypothetical protein BBJ57_13935 [Desulfobacterales bacterium PC51MH44]